MRCLTRPAPWSSSPAHYTPSRHSREGGNPAFGNDSGSNKAVHFIALEVELAASWIPAFAGMAAMGMIAEATLPAP